MTPADVIAVVFAVALAAGLLAIVVGLAVRAPPSTGDLAKAGATLAALMVGVVFTTYRGRDK